MRIWLARATLAVVLIGDLVGILTGRMLVVWVCAVLLVLFALFFAVGNLLLGWMRR